MCLLFGFAAQGEIYVGGRERGKKKIYKKKKERLSALLQEHLGISVHTRRQQVMFVSAADQ